MEHFGLCTAVAVSFFVLTYGESTASNEPSDIFQKYHTSVMTVVTERARGTGFVIELPNTQDLATNREELKGHQMAITAAHVVKGARVIFLQLYKDRKDSDGNWEFEECSSNVDGLDVVRDVALLSIPCDKCDCTSLKPLQTRLSKVDAGEKVLVIGDSDTRLPHSFLDGMVSATNVTKSTASIFYKIAKIGPDYTAFKARHHALNLAASYGDSGSAVMDKNGNVIGIISFVIDHLVYCVTVEEVYRAYVQISNSLSPQFVSCTAHESALLGKIYWGENSGKSIQEMNALAAAMGAQYFAVSHDGKEAHAFTFHLLWTLFLGGAKHEDESQCTCELSSFTDGRVLEKREDGTAMCGCSGNACRRKQSYKKRFGEENDRRWAIYKIRGTEEKRKWYVPSKESLASMTDIANEIQYWKERVRRVTREKAELVSRHKISTTDATQLHQLQFSIVVAVAVCVALYLFTRCRTAESMLKRSNTELTRLEEEQSQQDVPQNADNINLANQE